MELSCIENFNNDFYNDIVDITEAFVKEYGLKSHIISLITFKMNPIKLNSLKIVWSSNPYLNESIVKRLEQLI